MINKKAALRIQVTGRVQAVGFRQSTLYQARRLGICGWVKNEADGTVLAHIQGDEAGLQDMQHWLKQGPSFARVDKVVLLPASWDENLRDFRILY